MPRKVRSKRRKRRTSWKRFFTEFNKKKLNLLILIAFLGNSKGKHGAGEDLRWERNPTEEPSRELPPHERSRRRRGSQSPDSSHNQASHQLDGECRSSDGVHHAVDGSVKGLSRALPPNLNSDDIHVSMSFFWLCYHNNNECFPHRFQIWWTDSNSSLRTLMCNHKWWRTRWGHRRRCQLLRTKSTRSCRKLLTRLGMLNSHFLSHVLPVCFICDMFSLAASNSTWSYRARRSQLWASTRRRQPPHRIRTNSHKDCSACARCDASLLQTVSAFFRVIMC